MKIATYNVNGVNGRLPVLLHWLAESKPDVACLQELKAPNEKFPIDAIREAANSIANCCCVRGLSLCHMQKKRPFHSLSSSISDSVTPSAPAGVSTSRYCV